MVKVTWAERLKKWRKEHEDSYAKALLSPPTKSTLYRAIPFPGVVLILGRRRMGKSGLAHEITNQLHNKKGVKAVLHLPFVPLEIRKRVQRLLPSWLRVVTKKSEWPTNSVVIYDEASQSAHARRTQSGDAIKLDNLISVSGQRNQTILFISHHSRKLDLNIIHEVDRIIWKSPTYAHAIFERDELSDFTYRALQFFNTLKSDNTRLKATLMMDFHNFQFSMFQNSLAPWWSDRLSRIFQDIDDMMERG